MSIWRWANWITPVPEQHRVTLGEGNTPLVRSTSIGPAAGLENLWLKLESGNPAGSFKDRFGAAAISAMRAENQTRCVATSSGNTGSAVAAYCAAAGMRCEIAVVETAPQGKLRQMMAYGANVYRIKDFGLDPDLSAKAFETLMARGEAPDARLQVSSYIYSVPGMTGVETISFELAEQAEQQLQRPIDHVFCPAEVEACAWPSAGVSRDSCPKAGCPSRRPSSACSRRATTRWQQRCRREPTGPGRSLAPPTSAAAGAQRQRWAPGGRRAETDRRPGTAGHRRGSLEPQQRLATEEGIFTEPAGATALAGCLEAATAGRIDSGAVVICLVTGSGFKDEASVDRMLDGIECPTLTWTNWAR
ncbi:MAG: threonine synthase [Planctomycetaceae bacterium]|nr:MAG: threonine synthase [Planctomycetaceae bacterium]